MAFYTEDYRYLLSNYDVNDNNLSTWDNAQSSAEIRFGPIIERSNVDGHDDFCDDFYGNGSDDVVDDDFIPPTTTLSKQREINTNYYNNHQIDNNDFQKLVDEIEADHISSMQYYNNDDWDQMNNDVESVTEDDYYINTQSSSLSSSFTLANDDIALNSSGSIYNNNRNNDQVHTVLRAVADLTPQYNLRRLSLTMLLKEDLLDSEFLPVTPEIQAKPAFVSSSSSFSSSSMFAPGIQNPLVSPSSSHSKPTTLDVRVHSAKKELRAKYHRKLYNLAKSMRRSHETRLIIRRQAQSLLPKSKLPPSFRAVACVNNSRKGSCGNTLSSSDATRQKLLQMISHTTKSMP